ncbi:hypothetical protein IF650_06165 [Cellulosimicrobium terreum]|nr:hypothetical protein [Cellulosimicrobium terreum]
MTTYGADVAALRALAAQVDTAVRDLEAARRDLTALVEGTRWIGLDADELRGRWSTTDARALTAAVSALDAAASALRRNADEQERASSVTGGSPSGTGTTGGPGSGGTGAGGTDGQDGPAAPTGDGAGPPIPANLAPTPGGALDDIGDTTRTLKSDGDSVTWTENGFTVTDREEVKLSGGAKPGVPGVSGSASTGYSTSAGFRDPDGYAVYTLGYEASGSVEGSARFPGPWQFGLTAGASGGVRGGFELWVPDGVDFNPTLVDPNDPATMPPGTRIVTTSSDFTGSSGSAKFWWLSAGGSAEQSTGVTSTIQSLGDDVVRITAGDTESMKTMTDFGVGVGDYGLTAGGGTSFSQAQMGSVELDLSIPEGRSAYDDFLATGGLPTEEGTGVANQLTYETFDLTDTDRWGFKLPSIAYSSSTVDSTSTGISVTHGDGSMDYAGQAATNDIEISYSGHVDANGVQDMSANTYTLAFPADAQTNDWLASPNGAIAPGVSAGSGDLVQISFDESQAAELQQLAYDSLGSNGDPTQNAFFTQDPLYSLVYDADPNSPDVQLDPYGQPQRTPGEFMSTLVQDSGSSAAVLERLALVMARTGTDGIPGEVSAGG